MALLTLPWWPLSPWLSPAAAWFIFFNAVVGAIAVMSTNGATQAGQGGAGPTSSSPSRRRLCRNGSSSMVLDRLRSFFVFPTGPSPPTIDDDSCAALGSHCYYCCSRQAGDAPATQVCRAPESGPLAVAATTSVMAAISTAAQPSAPLGVATAEDHTAPTPSPPEEEMAEAETEEEEEQDHESVSLDEAYALAQRHSAPPRKSPPPEAASATAATTAMPTARRKKVVPDWQRVSGPGEALEDPSCRGSTLVLLNEGKAELNARAEQFIRQFREDLKLQRLNSILRRTQALGSPAAAR